MQHRRSEARFYYGAIGRLMELLERIDRRQAVIAIIGLGYVGLPLAIRFSEVGFPVIGVDVDESRVEKVNGGSSYISDVSEEALAAVTRKDGADAPGLMATSDFGALDGADVAIICVNTPLSKTRDPDLSSVVAVCDEIAVRLHREMLVVLESTSYPGTTEELILPRLQSANGRVLAAGVDFFLAFSPERVDPGRTDWTLWNTPKVIGGTTPRCLEAATKLYEAAVETVVPVSSPKVAEMVKLLENTFRATNIALVNEIAIMCGHLGLDVWEVIAAAETKPFGFMPFYPGPGLGGHCLPVDPNYLAWKLRTLNYSAKFIQLAEEVNLGMPAHVVGKVADALNEDGKPIKGSKILVLGVSYKADVGDPRDSPALDVIDLLREKGALVQYHDPYVPSVDVNGRSMESSPLEAEGLHASDCVVVATAHARYSWQWIVDHSRLVVDTRNATRGVNSNGGRIVKL